MREVHADLIKAHTAVRFRSEYDYALFEYYRSAKVIAFLESAGVTLTGRALDCGCGGGGMPLSLAEHLDEVVGIDPFDRFSNAGVRLASERGVSNIRFARADGMALPFPARAFNLVLSHAVIEHVPNALQYLTECRRVLADRGYFYLSTAPYLSFAGAHLPRLYFPVPLHLLVGRDLSFRTFRWLARRAPWALKEQAYENTFILNAQRGIEKEDDLLEKIRVRRLRRLIERAGLRIVREQLWPTGTVRSLPAALGQWLTENALTQDVLLSNIEYVLTPVPAGSAKP